MNIPSNIIPINPNKTCTNKLDLWFLTGISDAEGSFGINISKDSSRKSGYIITHFFMMGLNIKDRPILESIKSTLGVGEIYLHPQDNTCRYKVSNIDQLLNVIIPHFKAYPLVTQKEFDFKIFQKILKLVKDKSHLTSEGLQEIVNLKSAMNLGLSDNLSEGFPNTKPYPRVPVKFKGIPDPNWLIGFIQGEACFYVSVYKSPKSKIGSAVQLVFKLTQHLRDIELIKGIVEYLNCGRVEVRATQACDLTITSIRWFESKIFPLLINSCLTGTKLLDFQDFYKVYNIMKVKGHLTVDGFNEILKIKEGMNTGRK